MNTLPRSLLLALCLAATGTAWSAGEAAPKAAAESASTASSLADGEVKKIDKENGKLTLKHGELKNLGMPGMTMVFRVQDPTMLDKLQPGDKVRFAAEKADGAIVVTQIERAK